MMGGRYGDEGVERGELEGDVRGWTPSCWSGMRGL
jgi:hypothetical protein